MGKKQIEPTPNNFESYEAAADFWDAHDTTDYAEEFRTVQANTDLRARHFEMEIDETIAKVLQLRAREQGVKADELASHLLRQQLGIAA